MSTQLIHDSVAPGDQAPQNAAPAAQAFGDAARAYAERLPAGLKAIVCDGDDVAQAYAAATALRRAGIPFYAAPQLFDTRGLLVRQRTFEMLSQFNDPDARRVLFENLNDGNLSYQNKPFFAFEPYPQAVLGTMREFAQMGDALLFRSQTERNAVCARLRISPSYTAIFPGFDFLAPDVVSDPAATRVIVWAPRHAAQDLSLYAYALWELKTPAIFICQGELLNSPHEFVSPIAAADALAQAAVIVDVELNDPAPALAFAGRGFGLCAAATTGLHEYVQGAQLYDATNFYSILSAVSRARAQRRPKHSALGMDTAQLQAILSASQPQQLADPPLVSIVIPTYNRPHELKGCLDAMAAQDYPNFEVIVVNDAGDSVADVVAAYPFARYMENAENLHVCRTINAGTRAARGVYVGHVADDDRKYPHHISALVEALQASHLPVAHADILLRLDSTDENQTPVTYGHLLFYENANDPTAVLWGASASHVLGYLVDAEFFAAVGMFDPTAGLASDCELILKLSALTDFAHVRGVHGEQVYRDNGTNSSAAIGQELPKIIGSVYARFCPPERQLIIDRQRYNVEATASAQQKTSFFTPRIALRTPLVVGSS